MKNSGTISSIKEPVGAPIREGVNPSPRILLVDDDYYIRELNAGVLIRFGYTVDTAADGADAWKCLHDASYDLLITDNRMPIVTGLELIKQLRSEDMLLPVILASGTVLDEELKQHPWLQLDATLPKPFTISELLDTVKKVLNAADDVRLRVETDFPVIMQAISEIEPPSRNKDQPPAVFHNGEMTSGEEPAIPPAGSRMYPPHRILVVDDDADTRQLSIDVLAGSGYEVEWAKDGAAGWEALQANDYNLVITDNKMPRLTGVEMIEKLRSATMSVPVIMATGELPVHEFARRPWLKPDASLQRPVSNDLLLATVKKVLRTDDGNSTHMKMLLPLHL
jgi:DNA-binding response OmpR family regulator